MQRPVIIARGSERLNYDADFSPSKLLFSRLKLIGQRTADGG